MIPAWRGWVACGLTSALAAGGGQPSAFDQARMAFMSHDLPAAEAAYRQVLAGDTVAAHRREAAVTLAAISWRVRRDTAAAERILGTAAATPGGRFAALAERSRMLREYGDYAAARKAATDASAAAATPAERDEANVAWASAVVAPLLRDRLGRAGTGGDPALLPEAVARLDSLVRRAPGRLEPARLLVLAGALAEDWPALVAGWHSYYLVGTGDTLRGPLAASRRALRALDAAARSRTSRAQAGDEVGGGHARGDERTGALRALAGSRFFDAAAALALAPGPGGQTLAARDPYAREIVAYAAFLDRVTRTTDEYYRKAALGPRDTTAWKAALDSAGRGLWPRLIRKTTAPKFTLDRLSTELDRRFGTLVNLGETAGYLDLHMGHRVVDDRRTVRQYGRSATVRFVALDGMVSNGFQSWAWDGRAEHGGWATKALIVQVRSGYAESPLRTWRDLADTALARRAAERIAADSAADLARARQTPVAYFPSVEERLERDGRQELLDSLRQTGLTGAALEGAFEREIGAAVVEFSIFAHEGRHAIDDGLGVPNDPALREYRAKLSQVAFAPRPRLAFDGIMSPNVGDDTPHGKANLRMLTGIEAWMREHAAELPVDPALPLLPQLPRLSDASLRAAGGSLDPLAGRRP